MIDYQKDKVIKPLLDSIKATIIQPIQTGKLEEC